MDGSNPVVIVENLEKPAGIFVDSDSSRVFWVDFDTDKIQSSDLNGGDVHEIIQLLQGSQPLGIFVFRDRIYWAN